MHAGSPFYSHSGAHFLPHLIPHLTLFKKPPRERFLHSFFLILEILDRFEVRRGSLCACTQVFKFLFIYFFIQRYRNSLLKLGNRNRIACLGIGFPWLLGSVMEARGWWNLEFTLVLPELRKLKFLLHGYPFILRVYLIILKELVPYASLYGTFSDCHSSSILKSSPASAG